MSLICVKEQEGMKEPKTVRIIATLYLACSQRQNWQVGVTGL